MKTTKQIGNIELIENTHVTDASEETNITKSELSSDYNGEQKDYPSCFTIKTKYLKICYNVSFLKYETLRKMNTSSNL